MTNIIQKLIQMDVRATLVSLWKRFPVSVLLVIMVSLLWFYIVNRESTHDIDWVYRTIITGVVVFFLSTTVALMHDRVTQSKWVSIGTWMIPILFGICFYLSIGGIYDGDIEAITYMFLALSGFFASLFVAPFIIGFFGSKKENITHFSNYFTQVAWVMLMSLVVGGALMALGSIAIGSVLALFDISDWIDEGKLFGNWAIISLSLIAPLYALAVFPHARDYEKTGYTQNRFFSFIIRYIATPFIFVYFLILYAYSAKVLMNFSDWPKGIISWMVIGFSSFGYLIYILSRAYVAESRTVDIFRKHFPYMVAPQILMLAYAIYLRIAQYDLTMNRYFVVVFGIWLTIISVYYIVSAKKYLSFIPMSLVAIILLISLGPWSVYSLPLARQESRLMTNLQAANILQNGSIVPLATNNDISRELSTDIYSEISYVCDFDDCNTIKELFPEQYTQADTDARKDWELDTYEGKSPYIKPSKYQIVSAVTQYIKVQQYWGIEGTEPKYLQFSNYKNQYPITVTGYDRVVNVYGSGASGRAVEEKVGTTGTTNADEYIVIDADTNMFTYYRDGAVLWSAELPVKPELTADIAGREVSRDNLAFSLTNEEYQIRIQLDSYALRNPDYQQSSEGDVYTYYSISGLALIRDAK